MQAFHRSAFDQADVLHSSSDAAVEAKLFHAGRLPDGELIEGIYVMHENNLLCSFVMEKESRPERTESGRLKMLSIFSIWGRGERVKEGKRF